MLIIILKAIIGWVIFMLVGTNLLGLIVRGLFKPPLENIVDDPLLSNFISKQKRTGNLLTIFSIIITILYFYSLYHHWNIGVAISAAMVMFSRLPDLLYEIRTGNKIKLGTMPKNAIDYFTTFILWAALPVLWYSLYCFK